jgi:hypothetical protein
MMAPKGRVARVNDHDRTEDDGLAPDERLNWERQETGEEASIQVYLDDGWYWDSRKLTHPTDKELSIRIDPLTRDWYPTTKLGKVIEVVVEREGRSGELFTDDKYPTVKLARLMVVEIGRAKRGGER